MSNEKKIAAFFAPFLMAKNIRKKIFIPLYFLVKTDTRKFINFDN